MKKYFIDPPPLVLTPLAVAVFFFFFPSLHASCPSTLLCLVPRSRSPLLAWPWESHLSNGPEEAPSSLAQWKLPLPWAFGSNLFIGPMEAPSSLALRKPCLLGPEEAPSSLALWKTLFLRPEAAPFSLALMKPPLPWPCWTSLFLHPKERSQSFLLDITFDPLGRFWCFLHKSGVEFYQQFIYNSATSPTCLYTCPLHNYRIVFKAGFQEPGRQIWKYSQC